MGEGPDPDDNRDWTEENTSYDTDHITISDQGQFVGRDYVRGDQYNVGRDMYQTEPGYEQTTTPLTAQLSNSVAGLLQLVGGDTVTALYERVEALPLWPAVIAYATVLLGISVLDLLQVVTLGLYYMIAFLPFAILLLPLLFTLTYDAYRCPKCGPFTLRRVRKSIVDTSLFRVFYRCTECGGTFDEETYTTEGQD